MDKQIQKAVADVLTWVSKPKVYIAVKYLSEKLVVRMTRPRYDGKLPRKGDNFQATLVIGKPNFKQREFIKLCKKSGEPFPVKGVQIKLTK